MPLLNKMQDTNSLEFNLFSAIKSAIHLISQLTKQIGREKKPSDTSFFEKSLELLLKNHFKDWQGRLFLPSTPDSILLHCRLPHLLRKCADFSEINRFILDEIFDVGPHIYIWIDSKKINSLDPENSLHNLYERKIKHCNVFCKTKYLNIENLEKITSPCYEDYWFDSIAELTDMLEKAKLYMYGAYYSNLGYYAYNVNAIPCKSTNCEVRGITIISTELRCYCKTFLKASELAKSILSQNETCNDLFNLEYSLFRNNCNCKICN